MAIFTIPTINQIERNEERIFSRISPNAKVTDFYLLLGGSQEWSYCCKGDAPGIYWLNKQDEDLFFESCWDGEYENIVTREKTEYEIGCCPVTKYSQIKSECYESTTTKDLPKVTYGEYPQYVVDFKTWVSLEDAYQDEMIKPTGKKYTIYTANRDIYEGYDIKELDEYLYQGKKYVRFKGLDSVYSREELSTGEDIEAGKVYWLEVEPVQWYIDKRDDIAICDSILFAGVQYYSAQDEKNGDYSFETSTLKTYLDNYFSKEISKNDRKKIGENNNQHSLKKQEPNEINPYHFDFKTLTDEELIKESVNYCLPIFLHGPSSLRKSKLIKNIDEDCIVINLRNINNFTLNGRSCDTPTPWLSKLQEKCQKDPNKIHILYLDEIDKCPESIKDDAYEIALTRRVKSKWNLPENVCVIVSGSDTKTYDQINQEESIYDNFINIVINEKTNSLVEWALENRIHPAIYSYLILTKDEHEDTTINLKRWEIASKILYKTNQPEILRGIIGLEESQEFISFSKQPVLSINEVINNKDLDNLSSKDKKVLVYRLALLSKEDEETVKLVTQVLPESMQNDLDNLRNIKTSKENKEKQLLMK